MSETLKKLLLSKTELFVELALDTVVEVGEQLAEEKDSAPLKIAMDGLKGIKSVFLDGLVDKIDGEEG